MDRVTLAARNNAHLYERVCAAHGCRTLDLGDLLLCLDSPPRYFSQAVVLARGADEVVRQCVTGGFKDSYHDLEPEHPAYHVLFSAEWIWREPMAAPPFVLEWQRVQTDSELVEWEAGWAHGDSEASLFPRQFPTSLLDAPDIEFWSARRSGRMLGGVMLNHTPPVVGVSNLFALDGADGELWRDFPQLIAHRFPGQATTGYEHGESLVQAQSAGFESIGPLRIWTR